MIGGITRRSGIKEVQRSTWVMSRPICSIVNLMMMNLSVNVNCQLGSSEQHKESTICRKDRDFSDMNVIIEYLTLKNPFCGDPAILRSISTGISAVKSVNVDDAINVGNKVISKMVGLSVKDFTPRRKDQCVLMTEKDHPGSKNKMSNIDPNVLFQRIMVVLASKKDSSVPSYFKFELSSFPLSLFDSHCNMRNANKTELAKSIAIMSNYHPEEEVMEMESEMKKVVNGGWLLHKIPWKKEETYVEIFTHYDNYLSSKYGSSNTTIVFDGYSGPSTKDMTHNKRSKTISSEVLFSNDMKLTTSKEEFLSNVNNKSRFLMELGNFLQQKGFTVLNSQGDADVMIVKTSIDSAKTHSTILVGEDTDLLVLLIHYYNPSLKTIHMKCEPRNGKGGKLWDIKKIQESLGYTISSVILFVHAFMGCDTTSKPFGKGKSVTLKLSNTNQDFWSLGKIFYNKNCTKNEIDAAGESAMNVVYCGSPSDNIDTLRYQKFTKKVLAASLSTSVNPEDLPPTSAAMKFHSRRTYFQVQ